VCIGICSVRPNRPLEGTLIRIPRGRWDLWALAELFALTGLAIGQPVLDVTGRSPDMFLFRRADRLDILVLVVGVTVLPALAIWVLEVLAGLVSGTVRRLLHLAAVTGLLVVLAFEVVKATTGLRGPGLAAVAAAGGLGGGVLYASLSWPRLWLRFLTPAPVIFALLFLVVSPTSALVLPARAPAAEAPPVAAATKDLPPVVMVLFDEFPLRSLLDSKGQIDRRVYPNFARLADQSTWYRNATGVAGFTSWAMPAMLTGNYPAEAGPRPTPSTPTTCSPCSAGPTTCGPTRRSASCARRANARRRSATPTRPGCGGSRGTRSGS
jgi:hypothetical protein